MKKWFDDADSMKDIVISSRVRLARNLYDYPFSMKISDDASKQLVDQVKDSFFTQFEGAGQYFDFYQVNQLNAIDKQSLVENHAISPMLMKKDQSTGLILSRDARSGVMINEEDHIRIQTISAGMNMQKVYEEANRIDDLFSERLKYAFNKKYGYITSCPTNLGTGLRASYMIHIPFLEAEGLIKPLSDEMNKFGFTIRGIYGEGSQALGSIYQISNQKTLGQSEDEIISSLDNIALQVINHEKALRERHKKQNPLELADRIYKAYGILKYARQLTSKDAMNYLSQIRAGLNEDVIQLNSEEPFNLYHLMIQIQPANLQIACSKPLTATERDVYRAELVREKLPEIK